MSENEANSIFPFVFSYLMAILGWFLRKERGLVEGSRIVTTHTSFGNNLSSGETGTHSNDERANRGKRKMHTNKAKRRVARASRREWR